MTMALTAAQGIIYGPGLLSAINAQLEMWANAQRDGRPAEYRWRPLFNVAVCILADAHY